MINVRNQPEQISLNKMETESKEVNENIDFKGDTLFVNRTVEQKSLLEIRFSRLKKAIRIRSSNIF